MGMRSSILHRTENSCCGCGSMRELLFAVVLFYLLLLLPLPLPLLLLLLLPVVVVLLLLLLLVAVGIAVSAGGKSMGAVVMGLSPLILWRESLLRMSL